MKKKVLITGATGMVGSWVLRELIDDNSVGEIISIGRRKTGVNSENLKEIVQSNFLDFSNLKNDLTNIDVCIYCLGVYQNQVSKDKFFEITCDYQKALTDILEETSPQLTFVLFGASGANPNEKGWSSYANAKGRAENYLNETCFPKKYIFRSGGIQPTGERRPQGFMYDVLMPVMGLLFTVFPFIGMTDRNLAKAMVKTGLEEKQASRVFSPKEIKEVLST